MNPFAAARGNEVLQPNKVGLKCLSVKPFVRLCVGPSVHKKFLSFQ